MVMIMSNTPSLRFKEFSKDWNTTSLDQCADVKQGFPFNSKTYVKKGNYNITINNGKEYINV